MTIDSEWHDAVPAAKKANSKNGDSVSNKNRVDEAPSEDCQLSSIRSGLRFCVFSSEQSGIITLPSAELLTSLKTCLSGMASWSSGALRELPALLRAVYVLQEAAAHLPVSSQVKACHHAASITRAVYAYTRSGRWRTDGMDAAVRIVETELTPPMVDFLLKDPRSRGPLEGMPSIQSMLSDPLSTEEDGS